MKRTLFLLSIILAVISSDAQVNKTIIVEHFTNTRCSVCASRNPGFYSNLENNPGILHVAFHPSAPYSNCVLNQHNVSGNDGRTNFYNVYGSTPRLVIQGDVISTSSNYGSQGLFTPYENQSSAFSLVFNSFEIQGDSLFVDMDIVVEDTHSFSNLDLYVGVFEDTIFYNAPNGEDEHYDVFRKAYTSASGTLIAVPANKGESINFESKIKIEAEWDLGRIFPVAILQETASKDLVQAAKGSHAEHASSIRDLQDEAVNFRNLIYNSIVVKDQSIKSFALYDLNGRLIKYTTNIENSLNVSELNSGFYFLILESDSKYLYRKVFISN